MSNKKPQNATLLNILAVGKEKVFSDNYFSRLTTIRFPVATTIITASDN